MHEVEVRIELHERLAPAIECAAFIPLASLGEIPELLVFLWESDAAAANPAVDAEDGRLEEEVVHAREDAVAIAGLIAQLGDAAGVRAAFLDGQQVRDVGELDEHLRRHIRVVADGVVVKHPAQWRGLRQRAEPLLSLARVALINHRRHDHETGCTELFAVVQVADGGARAHLRHTADDRHASGGHLHRVLHHRAFFIGMEALILAQRAADDQTVHAGLDLRLPKARGRVEVDRLVLIHLSDDGRKDAGPKVGFIFHG